MASALKKTVPTPFCRKDTTEYANQFDVRDVSTLE
jgi:hypothetical protein